MKKPPFCPNPHCSCHYDQFRPAVWFTKDGHAPNKSGGQYQRYKCGYCSTRFSTQTFSLDYHVIRHLPYGYIFKQLKSTAGIRNIARDLKVSPHTILNRIGRLARQSQAIHAALRYRIRLNEDLTADGFESFAVSQYFPSNIHILAGKQSQFLYGFDYAHLARKGVMTPWQKQKNSLLKTRFFTGTGITASFTRLCRGMDGFLGSRMSRHTVLFTDEKPQYHRVLEEGRFCASLSHVQINSKQPRTVNNVLFSVNYLDREFRKDCANHVRETVQFSRNVNHVMERLAVYRLYHNYMKPFRINGSTAAGQAVTHGEAAGLTNRELRGELKNLFTQRRFYHRIPGIQEEDMSLWFGTLATPLQEYVKKIPRYLSA